MLVQQSTIGALGWLCWCNRVLQKPLGSCAGTAEYNWRSQEAVLVQNMTLGHSRGCSVTAVYYRSTPEFVLVQKSTTGPLGRLCWYSRVIQEHSGGCVGTEKYYISTRKAVLVQQH